MATIAEDQYSNLTHESYFSLEEELDQKFEYIAGEIFAMSGGSVQHGLIGTNVTTTLSIALRATSCTVYNSDVKLRIDSVDGFFYPDAMVLCDEGKIEDKFVQQPKFIIEVLSPSTEGYDHGQKFAYYRQIKSLQNYIMLHQDQPLAEAYQRCDANGWLLHDYRGLDAVIPLVDGLELPMADLYRQAKFNINSQEAKK